MLRKRKNMDVHAKIRAMRLQKLRREKRLKLFKSIGGYALSCLAACLLMGGVATAHAMQPVISKEPASMKSEIFRAESAASGPPEAPVPKTVECAGPEPAAQTAEDGVLLHAGAVLDAFYPYGDEISEGAFQEDMPEGALEKYAGTFEGPSGRETWYDLPMGGVVRLMRSRGYSEEEYPYWIRGDGVKMLGDYVMVAANLETRPKGTILETSLGTAIVCDTGDFVLEHPDGVDIAVDWKDWDGK